jgi:hypothetical protein
MTGWERMALNRSVAKDLRMGYAAIEAWPAIPVEMDLINPFATTDNQGGKTCRAKFCK